MEKYRTAGRLIILRLVTSLQERQRHWRFALQQPTTSPDQRIWIFAGKPKRAFK